MSPKLDSLMNTFEKSIAERLKILMPADKQEVRNLSWMQCAIKLLFEIHRDLESLISALELPIHHCNGMWTDAYFDTSMKLLEICTALNNQISQLQDGHLFLRCAVIELKNASFVEARTSLDEWKQQVDVKNPRLDEWFSALDNLKHMLDRPNIKNSAKEKVFMKAIYGVKVVTLFVASIFTAAFTDSEKILMDVEVPKSYLWAKNFIRLQSILNTELRHLFSSGRVMVVNEREAVAVSVEELFPIWQNGVDSVQAEAFPTLTSELEKASEKLAQGLDLLAAELKRLIKDVICGRDGLLHKIRIAFNDN